MNAKSRHCGEAGGGGWGGWLVGEDLEFLQEGTCLLAGLTAATKPMVGFALRPLPTSHSPPALPVRTVMERPVAEGATLHFVDDRYETLHAVAEQAPDLLQRCVWPGVPT